MEKIDPENLLSGWVPYEKAHELCVGVKSLNVWVKKAGTEGGMCKQQTIYPQLCQLLLLQLCPLFPL